MVRLVHPFPSILDGLVVGAVAVVAGGDALVAIRLGVAMTALQFSIGALNDLVDAPIDAGRKPGKPIPAGLVSADAARVVVVTGASVGLVLAVPSGPPTVALAGIGLAIGYGYDLWSRGTAWSWLPLAVGIPLIPVFGWLGATGTLPPSFVVLVPVAVVAGAALAIANARVDVERDAAAGVGSVAIRLGLERAWSVHVTLLMVVGAASYVTLWSRGSETQLYAAAVGATLVIALGAWLGRRGDSVRRERAWELEAVGIGLLAIVWLAGMS